MSPRVSGLMSKDVFDCATRSRIYRLRKNSCFVIATPRTRRSCRHWFYRLRKNSCFVSGHDFSRAVKI